MRIAKSILLFLAVVTCLTFAVSAQTTSSSDSSSATKKDDSTPSAPSIVARNTSDAKNETTDGTASSTEAKGSSAAKPQAASDEWHFVFAPYLWLAGIKGTVGVGDLTTDIDPGVSDILDVLKFGFIGTFEARKNKLMLITDVMYISLEKTKDTTGPLFSALKVNEKTFFLSPMAGYRLAEKNGASLDVIAGIRYWHTSTRLEAEPGQLPGRVAESSKNWADVIGGLRGLAHVSRLFSLVGRGDFGGGGSDYTYQLFGAVGIDVSKKASLFAGYRYLYVKNTRDNSLFDGALNGPILGAAFRF
jgi:hypothetical protein